MGQLFCCGSYCPFPVRQLAISSLATHGELPLLQSPSPPRARRSRSFGFPPVQGYIPRDFWRLSRFLIRASAPFFAIPPPFFLCFNNSWLTPTSTRPSPFLAMYFALWPLDPRDRGGFFLSPLTWFRPRLGGLSFFPWGGGFWVRLF